MESYKEKPHFFEKLSSLPLVRRASEYTLTGYFKLKEYNWLLKTTLDMTESKVQNATAYLGSIASDFEKPISVANDFACKTLDELQRRAPIIAKTPEEAYAEVEKIYTDAVKPVMDSYNSVKQYGLEKVNFITEKGAVAVNVVLASPCGKLFVQSAHKTLNIVNEYADGYLPPHRSDQQRAFPVDGTLVQKSTALVANIDDRLRYIALVKIGCLKHAIEELIRVINQAVVPCLQSAKFTALEFWVSFRKESNHESGKFVPNMVTAAVRSFIILLDNIIKKLYALQTCAAST